MYGGTYEIPVGNRSLQREKTCLAIGCVSVLILSSVVAIAAMIVLVSHLVPHNVPPTADDRVAGLITLTTLQTSTDIKSYGFSGSGKKEVPTIAIALDGYKNVCPLPWLSLTGGKCLYFNNEKTGYCEAHNGCIFTIGVLMGEDDLYLLNGFEWINGKSFWLKPLVENKCRQVAIQETGTHSIKTMSCTDLAYRVCISDPETIIRHRRAEYMNCTNHAAVSKTENPVIYQECPLGWQEIETKDKKQACFYFGDTPVSFHTAQTECVDMNGELFPGNSFKDPFLMPVYHFDVERTLIGHWVNSVGSSCRVFNYARGHYHLPLACNENAPYVCMKKLDNALSGRAKRIQITTKSVEEAIYYNSDQTTDTSHRIYEKIGIYVHSSKGQPLSSRTNVKTISPKEQNAAYNTEGNYKSSTLTTPQATAIFTAGDIPSPSLELPGDSRIHMLPCRPIQIGSVRACLIVVLEHPVTFSTAARKCSGMGGRLFPPYDISKVLNYSHFKGVMTDQELTKLFWFSRTENKCEILTKGLNSLETRIVPCTSRSFYMCDQTDTRERIDVAGSANKIGPSNKIQSNLSACPPNWISIEDGVGCLQFHDHRPLNFEMADRACISMGAILYKRNITFTRLSKWIDGNNVNKLLFQRPFWAGKSEHDCIKVMYTEAEDYYFKEPCDALGHYICYRRMTVLSASQPTKHNCAEPSNDFKVPCTFIPEIELTFHECERRCGQDQALLYEYTGILPIGTRGNFWIKEHRFAGNCVALQDGSIIPRPCTDRRRCVCVRSSV
ncbi:C-type lectin protein [Ranid herpesvirus 3]|uniref:C-type lectin protein n=1 Tax=Ranid herpesvirus 3 TaxID=1987509 RepID=A0A1X9T5F2_9VIRU|nr:C-type lectin protein [Ranid herpesvirus 3]ARR28932.1 C-type lectin protein [Ranid herpesvirus 3]